MVNANITPFNDTHTQKLYAITCLYNNTIYNINNSFI